MKGKLNLNEPASRMIAVIGLFLIVIPLLLSAAGFLLSAVNIQAGILDALRNGSIVVGLILGAGFVMLIVVEQIQDHMIDRAYQRNRSQKLPLPGGGYECQYCGSRKLQAHDKSCPVCGHLLE